MRPACRRALRAAAFTLTEMLIVVGVVAIVAGAVVMLSTGAVERADEQMVRAELAEVRKAVLEFRSDVGEAPRLIAELLQSPDPSDARGGWWWRTDDTPPEALYAFDPATRRGWAGPYLHADDVSADDDETAEARLVGAVTYEESVAVPSAGRRLTILLSRYTTFPQKTGGDRLVSHYQFDAADAGELAVRFVRDPLAPPGSEQVVVRLGLGIEP